MISLGRVLKTYILLLREFLLSKLDVSHHGLAANFLCSAILVPELFIGMVETISSGILILETMKAIFKVDILISSLTRSQFKNLSLCLLVKLYFSLPNAIFETLS